MSTGPWNPQPPSRNSRTPDLDEFVEGLQKWLKPRFSGGKLGTRGFGVVAVVGIAIWAFSGIFRVEADEHGVVLRFGEIDRLVQPGLHYHLPYPIEQVATPKVTRLNRVDIGMRLAGDTRRVAVGLEVPEEGLMLTGDENIVDVNFTVLWRVSPTPGGTTDYLFNVRNQESTVKTVAESAMREVIGRSLLQPILTEGRQIAEGKVQELMQRVLGESSFIKVVRDERPQLTGRMREQVDREATGMGITVLDLRIRRADLPDQNSQAVYQRMETERQREAAEFRALGNERAQEIRARADREVTVLVAEASSKSEQIRGDGDAERNSIFATAYNRDRDFFAFYRTIQAYQKGFTAEDTRMLLKPNTEFFQYFGSQAGRPESDPVPK
jgi:HflC protein